MAALHWNTLSNGVQLGDGSAEGGAGTFRGEINRFNTGIATDVAGLNTQLATMAPVQGKMVLDGNLPTVDMVYGASNEATMNVIRKSDSKLKAQFLYAQDGIILRTKADDGSTMAELMLMPDGSVRNPTAHVDISSCDSLLTAQNMEGPMNGKASVAYVNSVVINTYTGTTIPSPTLGHSGDRYHRFLGSSNAPLKSGNAEEGYSNGGFGVFMDNTASGIQEIFISPSERKFYISYGANGLPPMDTPVFAVDGQTVPLTITFQSNKTFNATYDVGAASIIEGIDTGDAYELLAQTMTGKDEDYTKFNDEWFYTPIYDHTYDFVKVGGTGNEITISTDTWTDVLDTQLELRKAGVYEYKHSATFNYSSTGRSAEFRFSLDGGNTWEVRTKEVKDTTNEEDTEALFPFSYGGGTPRLRMQARCESSSDTLKVMWASQILERKK